MGQIVHSVAIDMVDKGRRKLRIEAIPFVSPVFAAKEEGLKMKKYGLSGKYERTPEITKSDFYPLV